MNKIINIGNKSKGFTLVEILLVIGVLSLTIIGVYVIFNVANGWMNSNEEATQLSNAMERLSRATSASGIYTGVTKATLDSLGGEFNSKFNLTGVESPVANKLNINYADISNRNCANFVSKILAKGNYVTAIINGTNIDNAADISTIVNSCNRDLNTVTVVMTSNVSVTGLAPVTPTP